MGRWFNRAMGGAMTIGGLLAATTACFQGMRWEPDLTAPSAKGLAVLPDGSWVMPGHANAGNTRLVCFRSTDRGKSWEIRGEITVDPKEGTDLGDGNLVVSPRGRLYATARHNHHGAAFPNPNFAIEVFESKDQGKTWEMLPPVATSRPTGGGPSRGLWAPFLFITEKGELQCYYDDENTPFLGGFPGHQWLMMRRLGADGVWSDPIVVARAARVANLSREGMASVIQVSPKRLLCAYESVQYEAPHAGLIRFVVSEDNGLTWNWKASDGQILYQPQDRRFHAFAPSLAKLPGEGALAVFATNEDRSEPGISGTPARNLNLDIKCSVSRDSGKSWPTSAETVYGGVHQNYLPFATANPSDAREVLITFLDFARGCRLRIGRFGG